MQHNRLLGRANAAQQCDDVAFSLDDGTFEGGVAVPEGTRVSRQHKRRSEASSDISHWSFAAASAFADSKTLQLSTCPFKAEKSNGVRWLETGIQRCFSNATHEHDLGHVIQITHIS